MYILELNFKLSHLFHIRLQFCLETAFILLRVHTKNLYVELAISQHALTYFNGKSHFLQKLKSISGGCC